MATTLRSSVIGDCLQRLFRFQGHRVVSDIHLGDWGLQMGMLVREVERRHPELPYFDPSFDGDYPAEPPVDMDDLQVMYPAASERCKADEAERLAARLATADLQDGRRGYRALWQHFVDVSVSALRTNYDALGVSFDLWNGESTVQRSVGPLTERLEASGLLEESDGAKIIRVSDDADAPPLIFLKRDGGATYGTTDMATILERVEDFDPDEIVYVVVGGYTFECLEARHDVRQRNVKSLGKYLGVRGGNLCNVIIDQLASCVQTLRHQTQRLEHHVSHTGELLRSDILEHSKRLVLQRASLYQQEPFFLAVVQPVFAVQQIRNALGDVLGLKASEVRNLLR